MRSPWALTGWRNLGRNRRRTLLTAGGLAVGYVSVVVIAGLTEEVHVTVLKALGMLGLGRENVERLPVDGQGRVQAGSLPKIHSPAIVCLQAGNVNTGAIDPIDEICSRLAPGQAWVHVDGAFGLWASASPALSDQLKGVEMADSWATDAHKWLNVPYDSGLAVIRQLEHLKASMSTSAAYLVTSAQRDPHEYTPEFSRRARGVEIWAALRSLGRQGLVEMVERCCSCARQFAQGLTNAGFGVLNEVNLNQVLVSFGSPQVTLKVIQMIQEQGIAWCGGTTWQGKTAMRISVSNYATSSQDVERCLECPEGLRTVIPNHGHLIFSFKPQGNHSQGNVLHIFIILFPGDGDPDSKLLLTHRYFFIPVFFSGL